MDGVTPFFFTIPRHSARYDRVPHAVLSFPALAFFCFLVFPGSCFIARLWLPLLYSSIAQELVECKGNDCEMILRHGAIIPARVCACEGSIDFQEIVQNFLLYETFKIKSGAPVVFGSSVSDNS